MKKIKEIKKKIKKFFFISVCVIISVFSSNINKEIFINSPNQLLPLLFTLLGLCITAYTFIYAPITTLIRDNNNEKISESLNNLLKSFEDDMLLIFKLSIAIIIVDIGLAMDIPFIKDIKIRCLEIESLKIYLCNLFISLSAILSFYSLYDIVKATFKILKKSFQKDLNNN